MKLALTLLGVVLLVVAAVYFWSRRISCRVSFPDMRPG
jgi:hypothetical protein